MVKSYQGDIAFTNRAFQTTMLIHKGIMCVKNQSEIVSGTYRGSIYSCVPNNGYGKMLTNIFIYEGEFRSGTFHGKGSY